MAIIGALIAIWHSILGVHGPRDLLIDLGMAGFVFVVALVNLIAWWALRSNAIAGKRWLIVASLINLCVAEAVSFLSVGGTAGFWMGIKLSAIPAAFGIASLFALKGSSNLQQLLTSSLRPIGPARSMILSAIKHWQRLLIAMAPVLGGAFGVLLALHAFDRLRGHALDEVESIAYLALYIFTVGSGLLYVQDPRRIGPILIAFALQIPSVSLPMLEYQLAADLNFAVLLGPVSRREEGGLALNWIHHISTDGSFRFWQFQEGPWRIGVNLFAAFLFVTLWQSKQKQSESDLERPLT